LTATGPPPRKQAAILNDILEWTDQKAGSGGLAAVGHRIVHGGSQFVAPVRLTSKTIEELARLTPMAPLHQEACLSPARTLLSLRPDLIQIGCFDTAFHAALEPPASRFALARGYEESGIRRYGFHGLSYEFIAGRLQEISPDLAGLLLRISAAAPASARAQWAQRRYHHGVHATRWGDDGHALRDDRSRHTSLPAARARHVGGRTRANVISQVRPVGRFRRLQRHAHAALSSSNPRAAEAIDLFAFEAPKAVCAMALTLEGLACLVFTGGIGEHAAKVRTLICRRLRWLGLELDPKANDGDADLVSSGSSSVEVRVIATSEETTIARHVRAMLT
jgi:acetate kinase